jgi:hypothetical protein
VRRPLAAAVVLLVVLAGTRAAVGERFAAPPPPSRGSFGLERETGPAFADDFLTLNLTRPVLGYVKSPAATLRGTDRNDKLTGTAADDEIYARGGADTIRGLGGNDFLNGGLGRDTIDGAAGDDRIAASADGIRDVVRCGAGKDMVNADLVDKVASDCEIVSRQLSRDRTVASWGAQHETQAEPDSLAVGATIVTAYQVGRFADGGAAGIGWSTSRDGARTWRSGLLPSLSEESKPPGPYQRVSDPVVGYDAVHRQWLIVSLVAGERGALVVSRSRDGVAWSAPVAIASSGEEIDKEWIACDNWTASRFQGRCYLSYLDVASHEIRTRFSIDGGLTWSAPHAPPDISPQPIVNGAQPVVRPNGELVVAFAGWETYTRPDLDAMLVTRSTDGGLTFSATTRVARLIAREVSGMRTGPLPSADVDSRGIVYLAWQDCSGGSGGGRGGFNGDGCDIVMSRSPVGDTWTVPETIASGDGFPPTDEFVPAIAVHPQTSGESASLALVYHSRATPDLCGFGICAWIDVYEKESSDGGQTWGAPQRLNAQSMPVEWIADGGFGRLLGDYISVSWVGGKAVPVFALATEPVGEEARQSVVASVR